VLPHKRSHFVVDLTEDGLAYALRLQLTKPVQETRALVLVPYEKCALVDHVVGRDEQLDREIGVRFKGFHPTLYGLNAMTKPIGAAH
jgi:hypothetical protein